MFPRLVSLAQISADMSSYIACYGKPLMFPQCKGHNVTCLTCQYAPCDCYKMLKEVQGSHEMIAGTRLVDSQLLTCRTSLTDLLTCQRVMCSFVLVFTL